MFLQILSSFPIALVIFLFTKIAIVDGVTLNIIILMKILNLNALYANKGGFLGHQLLCRTGDCNYYSTGCELEL
jgi:hypothetical protein